MKAALIFAAILTSLLTSESNADMLFRCKKNSFLHPAAYQWAEIEKRETGELLFWYGNGIESQMLEVYLRTQIVQTSPFRYTAKNSQYELEIEIENSKLKFELRYDGKVERRSRFRCD